MSLKTGHDTRVFVSNPYNMFAARAKQNSSTVVDAFECSAKRMGAFLAHDACVRNPILEKGAHTSDQNVNTGDRLGDDGRMLNRHPLGVVDTS